MNLKKIDKLIATKVMGWELSYTVGYPEPHTFGYKNKEGVSYAGFKPSSSMNDAWKIAEKLGLALIPQSTDGESYSWFACDIESVSYRGDEVAITPIDETEYSQETAPLAICAAALMTVGIDIEEVE